MEIKSYNLHDFLVKVVDGLKQGFHISDHVAHAAQTIGDMHVVTLVETEVKDAVGKVETSVKAVEQKVEPIVEKVETAVETEVEAVEEKVKEKL